MNLEVQPQVQPHHRLTTTCDRHPEESFTGFCASCLRERLASLEQSTAAATSSSGSGRLKTSTAATALKAIFRSSVTGDNNNNQKNNNNSNNRASSSFLPELRRSKSFSGAGKREGFSGVFEPQRRSCDVRVRSTLWSLFNQDDGRKGEGSRQVEAKSLGFSGVKGPVFESREEKEEIRFSNVSVGVEDIVEEEIIEEIEAQEEEEDDDDEEEEEEEAEAEEGEEEIVVEEEAIEVEAEEIELEIQEEIEVEGEEEQQEVGEQQEDEEEELKKMKDHIDQETQNKKPTGRDLKEIAGSFLFAASAFSKKLQNWRRKQKSKKHGRDASSTTMQVEKPYSEMADYGFGRRSCDTDPRFSLDAARMSFDDPRYSWDEPRASWDGYLIGRTFPKMAPMVSVVEDAPVPVQRSDNQIPVEEPRNSITENDITPGGSAQTRDYYSDSQRRRRSFERSSSMRKKTSGLVPEADETKLGSNAKEVSPTSSEQLHGPKLVGTDRDLMRDSNSNSLREEYYPENLDSGFKDSGSVCGGIERKGSKKSRRWSKPWNIWALIYRRSGSKDEEEERYHRGNVVERSLSESWQELRREPNGDSKGGLNRVFRSNSSVSARNSFSSVKSSLEANGNGGNGKKRRDEFVLERNRSARYSPPTNIDNGLLRFYLTPMNRRNGSGKSRSKNSHSIANSVLRLY